jgi:hypothetical protein
MMTADHHHHHQQDTAYTTASSSPTMQLKGESMDLEFGSIGIATGGAGGGLSGGAISAGGAIGDTDHRYAQNIHPITPFILRICH